MGEIKTPLWAITSYFNPLHYENRLKNYGVFRKRLHCPLVAVEMSTDGVFELTKKDADILLQIKGNDPQSILFQKERLLNIGLRNVPPSAEYVAWLDCDIILRPDWVKGTIAILKEFPVCQLFEKVIYMERGQLPEDITPGSRSLMNTSFVRGLLPSVNWDGTPGLAWAARKPLMDVIGGFYEAMVLGGGDAAFAAAICSFTGRKIDGWENYYAEMSYAQKRHYDIWARVVSREVRARIGMLSGDVYHLWHGAREDRKYATRYEGFRNFNFDPAVDLIDGEWSDSRKDLQEFARKYFEGRREDG